MILYVTLGKRTNGHITIRDQIVTKSISSCIHSTRLPPAPGLCGALCWAQRSPRQPPTWPPRAHSPVGETDPSPEWQPGVVRAGIWEPRGSPWSILEAREGFPGEESHCTREHVKMIDDKSSHVSGRWLIRHYAKWFSCIIPIFPNPGKWMLLLAPFYRWGNWIVTA